jgi:hypothetical protein
MKLITGCSFIFRNALLRSNLSVQSADLPQRPSQLRVSRIYVTLKAFAYFLGQEKPSGMTGWTQSSQVQPVAETVSGQQGLGDSEAIRVTEMSSYTVTASSLQ